MKTVSIVIPLYNAERFVEQTLECVLAQTWPAKEIIVVDDGSTDNSVEVVRSYRSKGVKLFEQENRGACAARNFGLAQATGAYIQFLDADDLMHPEKISKQMNVLQHADHRLVASSGWVKFRKEIGDHHSSRQFIDRDYRNPRQWLIDSWEGRGKGQTAIWLCHRDLLDAAGGWDETLAINQDGEYFCRVLLKASGIRYCGDALVYYRTGNADSISNSKSHEKASSLLRSYISYKENMLQKDTGAEARHALMVNFSSFIYEHYPRYMDLVRQADQQIRELGFERCEIRGGKNFRRLARLVGFYPALKLRSLFNGA